MKSINGRAYRVNGVEFRVLESQPYPINEVSEKFKEILEHKKGLIVAVAYRGTLISNITKKDGVVRLSRIEVKGVFYKNPKAISQVLCITEAMHAYELEKL